jgi:hypothetical protein
MSGLPNGSIDSLDAFRRNYDTLRTYFNGPASAQTKLAEWRRVKSFQFKHSADAIITLVDNFRKSTRSDAISQKQAKLSEVGVTEVPVNVWTYVAQHTDRGENKTPSNIDELHGDTGEIYDLFHLKHIVSHVPEETRRQMQQAIDVELPSVIQARQLENQIFGSSSDQGHIKALQFVQNLQQKMAPLGGGKLLLTINEIDRRIEELTTKIRERKHTGYYQKYLKYKAKYLALRKQLEQKN